MITRRIAASTGLSEEYVSRVMRTAGHRYKDFKIAKRGGGERRVSQPAKEVKLIQHCLIDSVFQHLAIHDSVYSYRKGRSTLGLANLHRRSLFLLRLDFVDFFGSITAADIVDLLDRSKETLPVQLRDQDLKLVSSAVCRGGRLVIGAPSSPILSNAIMFDFDRRWFEQCQSEGVTYSRYADDLYLSTARPNVLGSILQGIQLDLAEMVTPNLTLNQGKTTFSSKKYRRLVTGLVITPDGQVSLGRSKKRFIKGLVFKFSTNSLETREISFLRGFLSFAASVEPSFMQSLRKKYGEGVLDAIQQYETD